MIAANSPAILTKSFPAEQRGQALGLQATMTYLGLVTGPSLGGWLAEQFGWQAVFYINVPVGLLALLLSLRMIPKDAPPGQAERFDILGALSFMAGLVALLLGLNRGSEWGWSSPAVLALLAAALVLLAVFIRIERRARSPMLDLSLFGSRIFSTNRQQVINYICVYDPVLMPFYLIQVAAEPGCAGRLLPAQR
jgi:MFS family permease